MKAYLAAPIFTERDRAFNSYLEREILKRCPDLDLYLAQNNASINDKTGCANSADIYAGDISRLKNVDFIISIMSGDLPPIGSSYETAYFTSICENDVNKTIIALYDDCRDGSKTYSKAKLDTMLAGNAENQWSYINLLACGFVKKFGTICFTSDELIDAVERWYNIANDERTSGIYKITNLKNGLCYIGQTHDFHNRQLRHWACNKKNGMNLALYNDMDEIGLEYFKFEIIEKCDQTELDEKEKYWIAYYDSYNNGYNATSGGHNIKVGQETAQTVKVYSYNLDGSFDKEYISIACAVRDLGLKSNNITRAIAFNDNQHKSGNKMWRLQKFDHIAPYEAPNNGKEIFCYDKETRLFIQSYKNGTEAGIELTGKRQPHINDAAAGSRQSAFGLLWAYDYFDRLPNDYFENIKKVEVEFN